MLYIYVYAWKISQNISQKMVIVVTSPVLKYGLRNSHKKENQKNPNSD